MAGSITEHDVDVMQSYTNGFAEGARFMKQCIEKAFPKRGKAALVTQTIKGTEYIVPDGWNPIRTAPTDRVVNILWVGGGYTMGFVGETARRGETNYFAWREIEAAKGVERTFSDSLTNGVPV